MKNLILYRVIAGVFGMMLLSIPGNAQLVSCNAFLKGNYVEVGINGNGAFGSSIAAPAGYHPRGGTGVDNACTGVTSPSGTNLGFVADPAKDGWTVGSPAYFGDYFLPGTPQEGWSIEINGVQSNAWNESPTSLGSITGGSIVSCTNTGKTRSATWKGTCSGLAMTAITSLDTGNLFFTTTVTLRNTTGSTVSNVYYQRTVDPDNEEPITGNFSTNNTIAYQLPNTNNRTLVTAVGPTYSQAYLGLGTLDCRAKCFIINGGLAPTVNCDASYAGSSTNTYTGVRNADIGIGLVFSLGNIPAGDSVTFSYAYVLNASDLDIAFPTTPAGFSASGDTATDHASHDTAYVCNSSLTTVTIENGGNYTWAWTSLTGDTISATAGFSSQVQTHSSIVVLRAIGSPICSGPIDTLVMIINPSKAIPSDPTASNNGPLCQGSTLNLSASETTSGCSFSWNGPGSFTSLIQNPTISSVTTAGSGTYSVLALLNGCTSAHAGTTNVSIVGDTSVTFSYTGSTQVWTVPSNVTSIAITVSGASGGAGYRDAVEGNAPGNGGKVTATMAVTSGQVLNLYVGGQGTPFTGSGATAAGGFNGGATGGTEYGGGGGGASDIRISGTALSNRIVIAGGGGGNSYTASSGENGGAGGGLTGGTGSGYDPNGGSGGTQSAGGNGGVNGSGSGSNGSLGNGGNGASNYGGGGGGGYYGGGGGGYFASGGGGSSYSNPSYLGSVVSTQGANTGSGSIQIQYLLPLVISVQPADATVCSGNDATFGVTGVGPSFTYQWQINSGGGFTNISGATNSTLVFSATTSMSGNQYMCQLTNSCGQSGNSDAATLTVNPTPSVTATTATNVSCNSGSNGSITTTVTGGTPSYLYTWSGGASGSNPTGLSAGTYSVVVTDLNSCAATSSATITEPTAVVASSTSTDVLCNGGNTGTVTISATGGVGSYSGTGTFTALAAGPYTYTVTDGNSCPASTTVTVNQPSAVVASSTSTDALCNGGSTGTVTVSATGGVGSYTGTGTFTGLAAGPYTYTVTDGNSCPASTTVTVNQPTAVVASSTSTDVLCNGGSTGTVTVSATGGVGSYSGTGTFTALAAGPYTYTVTDGNSCPASTTVTVNQPSAVVASSTSTDVLCNGGSTGIVTVSATGGVGSYTGTGTFTGLAAGPYTYTVTDGNSCPASTTVTVNQPSVVVASSTSTDALCNGGSTGTVTVSATGGVGSYTGTGTFTGLAAGPYTYTVTDGNSCPASTTVTVNEPSAVVASSTSTDVLCNGGSTGTVTVSATGGVGSYTGTGTFTGLAAGPYTYTVTDGNSCPASTTVTVNQPSVVVASSTSTDALCNGGSTGTVTVSATGGVGSYTGTGTFTGLAAGPYTYTVTDGNSCPASTTVTVNQPSVVVASSTSTDALCNGGSTGTVTVSATGGVGSYTGTGTFTGLAAGPYTYTVTDGNSCPASTTVTVNQPSVVVASSTSTDALCNGGSTGTVTVSATGGVGSYSGTGTFTALAAGPYTYTVTDGNSCPASTTVTVNQPAAVVASSTSTDVLCNGGSTGTVTVSATGGVGSYTGTGTFTGLAAGPYTYTVTDGNSCPASTTVTVNQPSVVVASSTSTDALCNGGSTGTVTVSATGGVGSYTGTGTFTGLAAGPYTYSITDGNSCPASTTVTVNQPSAVVASSTSTDALCNGGSTGTVTVSATGGVGSYTGTGTFTGLAAGPYTYTVTDGNSCPATVSGTISQPAAIVVTPAVTNVSCNGSGDGSIATSVSGGTPSYGYLWSTGATTSGISGEAAGTYTLTVTDTHECNATGSYTITQPDVLSLAGAVASSGCHNAHNGSINSNVTGGTMPYSYHWSTGAVTANLSGLSAGTYAVTVTDAHGCTAHGSYTITNPSKLYLSVSETDALCNGYNGSIASTVSGGTPSYSYLWSNGATTATLTARAGSYSLVVSDANGCTISAGSTTIHQPTALSFYTSIDNVSCFGGSNGYIDADVYGGTGWYYTYTWSTGGHGHTSYDDLYSAPAGVYTVTVTDGHGCTLTQVDTITQPATALSLTAVTTNVTCHGSGNGSINTTVLGGTRGYSYNWGLGWFGSHDSDRTGLSAGTYNVTVTDANGCTNSGTYNITEPTAISISAVVTNVGCHGSSDGSINTTVSGGAGGYTYSWSNGSTAADQTGLTAGSYTVTVTDANGCTKTTTYTVTQPAAISITATIKNVNCKGSADGSINTTVSGGNYPYSYKWSNGSTVADPASLAAGTYSVTVTDAHGCSTTASYTITEPLALTASAVVTNVTCGHKDGSINLTIGCGTPAYGYSWSHGAHTAYVTGLSAGTYTCTVSDAKSCNKICSYTVNPCDNDNGDDNGDNGDNGHDGHDGHKSSNPSGNGTIPAGDAVMVYPNPTNGMFNVVIPAVQKSGEIVISDLTGRVIETRDVTNNTGEPVQFSLNNVAKGIYFVKVNAGQVNYVGKLIVR